MTSKKHPTYSPRLLSPSSFKICKVIHHGFPFQPTCMCHDPVSGLLVVGTQWGYIRVYGQEMVDRCFRLEPVSKIAFVSLASYFEPRKQCLDLLVVNYPNCLSLLSLGQTEPTRRACRHFAKEIFSSAHVTNKLLFFGAVSGNVYILNARTFELSSQIIHWNNAVGPLMRDHPGPVMSLSSNPLNAQKLFIGYALNAKRDGSADDQGTEVNASTGLLSKWNLKNATLDTVINMHSGITCMSWSLDGRNFICGHFDGSYSLWNPKLLTEAVKTERSHGLIVQAADTTQYHPIRHIQYLPSKVGDGRMCFSGGIHLDAQQSRSRFVTIVRRRSTNVYQMDWPVVAMSVLHRPAGDGGALAILLEQDLVFVDLSNDEFTFLESPHLSQLGSFGPITFFDYVASPDSRLYSNLLRLHKQRSEGYLEGFARTSSFHGGSRQTPSSAKSEPPFPLTGGMPGQTVFPFNEIVITGHMDGKICFWDSSATNLTPLYMISMERFLYISTIEPEDCDRLCWTAGNTDQTSTAGSTVSSDSSNVSILMSVKSVQVHNDEQMIVIGDGGHVTLLAFDMTPTDVSDEITDISVLEVPTTTSTSSDSDIHTPSDDAFSPSLDSIGSLPKLSSRGVLAVRVAARRVNGYHPSLICLFSSGNRRDLPVSPTTASGAALLDTEQWLVILVNRKVAFVDLVWNQLMGIVDIEDIYTSNDYIIFSNLQTSSLKEKQLSFQFDATTTSQEPAVSEIVTSYTKGKADNAPVGDVPPSAEKTEHDDDAATTDHTEQSETGDLALALADILGSAAAEHMAKGLFQEVAAVKEMSPPIEGTSSLASKEVSANPFDEVGCRNDRKLKQSIKMALQEKPSGSADKLNECESSVETKRRVKLKHESIAFPYAPGVSSSGRKSSRAPRFSTNLLKRISIQPLKLLHQNMGTESATDPVPKQEEPECHDSVGLLIAVSTGGSSTDRQQFQRLPPLLWIATSSNRVFAINVVLDSLDRRSMRITKFQDSFKLSSQPILVDFFTVTSRHSTVKGIQRSDSLTSQPPAHYVIIACVSSIQVCCIPDQCCSFEHTLSSEIQAAWLVPLDDSVILCTLDADSPTFRVFCLPQPNPLYVHCFSMTPDEYTGHVCKRLILSNYGMICCLLNPSELCKWSLQTKLSETVGGMYPRLLRSQFGRKSVRNASVARKGDSVDQAGTDEPRHSGASGGSFSLFRLFSGSVFDEESLFRSKPSDSAAVNNSAEPRGVFKKEAQDPNTESALAKARKAQSDTCPSVSALLKSGAERGEHLSQLETTTARMAEDSRDFQARARLVLQMQKERNEKWWQLWR